MRPGELREVNLLDAGVYERLDGCLHIVDRAEEHGSARLVLSAAAAKCHHALDDALLEGRVIIQKEQELHGAANGRGVTADVEAVLFEHLKLAPRLRRRPGDVAGIGVAGDGPQGLLAE